MEPLVFKIETQADDTGVRNYDKSLGGLDVSSKKASGALKSFSRELLNAKSGADVAAAGAESLSRILEKSLAGVVVIGGIKIVTDQINKMSEILRAVGESTAAAVTQLERMGDIKGIDDAIRGIGIVNQSLDTTTQKLGSIQEGNWFTKFIASTTGATEELKKQQITLEKLRDSLLAYGFASERKNAEEMSQLDDEQKQYYEIQQKLIKRLELIDQIKNADDRASATRDANALAGIETQNLTNKLMEEQSKKEEELHQKRIKEFDERAKKERELAEAQQKRFNDLYNAEIKAEEATQKRIDANNEAEKKAVSLGKDVSTAKQEQLQQVAGSALEITKAGTGGSGSTGGRETSFERGMRQAGERAYQQGRRTESDRVKQEMANKVNADLAAKGESRRVGPQSSEVQNRLKEEYLTRKGSEGEYSFGTKQAREATAKATQASEDFAKTQNDAKQASSSFETNLSSMKTGFDQAIKSAEDFAGGLVQNGENMVGNFLKAGQESNNLGDNFKDAGDAVDKFSEELKKVPTAGDTGTAAGKGKGGGGGDTGSLSSIEKLLQKNFDELKAYAHAT
jgi:hypothetical protein